MQLGAQAVFVGSGIFHSSNPEKFAKAIVQATARFHDPSVLVSVSTNLGDAMPSLSMEEIAEKDRLAGRGW